jgi:hypothetical protein
MFHEVGMARLYLRQSRRLENREPLKAGLFIYHLKVGGTKIDQVALFAYLHFPDA